MGEHKEMESMLHTAIQTLNTNMQMQLETIKSLQEENKNLKMMMMEMHKNMHYQTKPNNHLWNNNVEDNSIHPIPNQEMQNDDINNYNNRINNKIRFSNKFNNNFENKHYQSNNYKDNLEQEMIVKFKRNRKKVIKNKIIECIKMNSYSIPEIKEEIVDNNEYCSKATFYRYIEELKRVDYIHITSSKIVKIKPLVEAV